MYNHNEKNIFLCDNKSKGEEDNMFYHAWALKGNLGLLN